MALIKDDTKHEAFDRVFRELFLGEYVGSGLLGVGSNDVFLNRQLESINNASRIITQKGNYYQYY